VSTWLKQTIEIHLFYYPYFLLRFSFNQIWIDAGVNAFIKIWFGTYYYTTNHDLTLNTGVRFKANILFGYAFKTCFKSYVLQPL